MPAGATKSRPWPNEPAEPKSPRKREAAETWWPPLDEDEDQLANRCEHFRRQAADWPDWADLLVVTHWGFIRGLTGEAVTNGTLLRFDPVNSLILQS